MLSVPLLNVRADELLVPERVSVCPSFAAAAVETDNEKRGEIFNQIFTKAQDEAIYAVICNPEIIYACNANLKVPAFVLEGYYYVNQFAWA